MARLVCTKCGREKAETDFFKMKDGERCDMCKQCLTMHIDNRKPETFTWILEKFDVPYIEKKWIELSNKIYSKNPSKFGPSSVIGQYIRTMNMVQYADYCYADTDRLNFKDQKTEEDAARRRAQAGRNEEFEQELKGRLERGEISQAEYDTLTTTNIEIEATPLTFAMPDTNAQEDKILSELTEEDQLYLINKWGALYKPSEWVRMEQTYTRYANEYDMNVDREETLKKICKVSLKLDNAVDSGDMTAAKNYNTMLDTLRKSAAFTAAQNKEEKDKELDTIGELVALCERDGGIIEQFPVNPDEYPQDKIDFTIKDLKAYNYNLVVNELGLGDLIESYMQKLDQAEQADNDMFDDLITNKEEEAAQELTDAEAAEFQEFMLEQEIEDEADRLLEELGGE